ncbi:class I SAM-dependent methyltransferase [Microbacterium paludicola]|uniref:class I SAM-dependent methyltransferase n=1 Tax=Microbacterium paludicola TaxID=300019 RepID=UPI00387A0E13
MAGEDATVEWHEAREANLANWEERVALHEKAYGLEAYDDPTHLSDVVRHDLAALERFLPSLAGLDVCHLQCHIGTDTLSLARAGATVTGVDFSPEALAAAARLFERQAADATWVHSDVLEARAAVTGDFDLVYTSIGTICWLADLDRWAAQIAGLLRAGGLFYIRDGHPALYSLDENAEGLEIRYRYFPNGQAQQWDEETTYAGDGTLASTRTYEWPHPLSEVVNALIGAGLQILRLDEDTTLPWRFSDRMVEVPGGYAWPEDERDRVPSTFTVVARKPA